jgi:hypothetical protein
MAGPSHGLSTKLFEHRTAGQLVQQLPRRVGTWTASAQDLASGTKPFKPHFIVRAELRFELVTKPLRQRRAFAVRGDGNLQIPALHNRTIVEMAMRDVVDGVAQDAARFGLAKNSSVHT